MNTMDDAARPKTDINEQTETGREGKPKRKPGSFVLKITLAQFFRSFYTMLWIDIWVLILVCGIVTMQIESTIKDIEVMPKTWAEQHVERTNGLEVVKQDTPASKVRLHRKLEQPLGLVEDAYRSFDWVAGEDEFLWGLVGSLRYKVSVPQTDSGYTVYYFVINRQVELIYNGLLVLLIIEALLLLENTNKTRRATKNTLAPIQQLAQTAKSIGAAEKRVPIANTQERLELSGAINTLNQITAKELDTRIFIDNERAELRDLALAINSMLDRLDAAYNSQLRFVSDASHELRTPIAVIQGYANLIDRWGKEDPEALQESIDAIKAEAEGMQTLVEQLLFLARSDNHSIVMQHSLVDISDLTSDVARDCMLIAPDNNIITDIAPNLWVEGDSGLIKQALRIFLDNAVKYSPSGEQVMVGAARDGGNIKIWVTDNGIGIAAEDLSHVFERFYRSDESRARKTGGTGLGLSIAKWIVQRHDGYAEIVSRENIGTRLTMVIPAADESVLSNWEQGTA